MGVSVNDVIFTLEGHPVLVKKKVDNAGIEEVVLDKDIKNIQNETKFGLKNGLKPELKSAFKSVLTEVENTDHRKEIDDLYNKIKELQLQNTNPKLLKYLLGELHHKMVTYKHVPENFSTDPTTMLNR